MWSSGRAIPAPVLRLRRALATPDPDGGAGWSPSEALLEVLARSQELGAIGPSPLPDHVGHATGFLAAIRVVGVHLVTPVRFLDLGSGGGLPGLVLASQLPEATGTLLDGRVERARLLEAHVAALGWTDRLAVCDQRAEVAGRDPELRGRFSLVVARGFGPPPVTAECAAPFLKVGGLLVVSEPPAPDPARWPTDALAAFGLAPVGGPVTVPTPAGDLRFQVLRQEAGCDERWPRRTGIPAKRPIYRV